ncbi:hypothetical protein F5Y10DRAFT_230731 [Nemania abortiva]|nr:hypothetical protein F5Y10DRAFT_230731 [Nemania abortiva]
MREGSTDGAGQGMDTAEPLEWDPNNYLCEDCQRPQNDLYFCSQCTCCYCGECWPKPPPHRPGKRVATKHDKVDLALYIRLRDTFNPPSDWKTQDKLHQDDEETTWFAVNRDSSGKPEILYDSGRYASLVANGSTAGAHLVRFPALVSFIGQTGAGKSTLIKILIERKLNSNLIEGNVDPASWREIFPAPVVGSFENCNVPTSGDVHLYADPLSYFEERPIFYVDSEGLEGGEKPPIAAKHRDPARRSYPGDKTMRSSRAKSRLTKKWRFSRETSRKIDWADAPEKEKREFAVTQFYPRILYTFSDVIVFVLRNPRTFESAVVTRLVDWAAEVLNASTNQPRLPHAIIVINASDSRTRPEQWDVDYATTSLLESVSQSTPSKEEAERVSKLLRHWHLPQKPVRNVRDLLMCYYSSVRVVHIPDDDQYLKMEAQIEKLHSEIQSACEASMLAKKRARMLMNADELDELFQAAFEHFSLSLNSPFDLIKAARKNIPVPRDFAGNVTKVAVAIRDALQIDSKRMSVNDIFEPLSLMVASCIFLECSRGNWKGSALEFFDSNFRDACEQALQDFCKQFWPCEFERATGRCVNTLERHQKGHQLRGKQFPGDYIASFSLDGMLPVWLGWVRYWLERCQSFLHGHPRTREEDLVPQIHRHNIHRFFEQIGGSLSYISHSICLCCLRELPEHPLQCGHVLCTTCTKTYGELESRLGENGGSITQPGQISLTRCPLHVPRKTEFGLVEPRTIDLKPDLAGVRLLCLDGGGIRGIVELEVLKQIEMYLGGHLPIQLFFDLIVGTSTGGIIAAGLGIKNWRVSECIEKFETLADKAFTRRLLGIHDIPIIGRAGRKYRTKPFEEVLRTVFRDDYLFGGPYIDPGHYRTKVALTSTTATGSTPIVLANYNRPHESPFTEFLRPDQPTSELKIWEAIRATTAAPGYFKPFTKPETGQSFIDGAIYHNNPIYVAFEESKLLWPDVRHCLPDIVLSIGTGHNRPKSDIIRPDIHSAQLALRSAEVSTTTVPQSRATEGDVSQMFQNFRMMFTRMSNVLNSHIRWVKFEQDVTLSVPRTEIKNVRRRLQRIDPHLGYDPPSLDDKAKMGHLKKTVNQVLKPSYRRQIRHVARRLVASCFYFEKIHHHAIGSGHYQFNGRILCKFPNNSHELSHLGFFLATKCSEGNYERGRKYPFFRIEEQRRPHIDQDITSQIINKMCKGKLSIFDFDRVDYRVSNKNAEVTISMMFWDVEDGKVDIIPISGFPRRIITESSLNMPSSPSFGPHKISHEEYWSEINSDTTNYPKAIEIDNEEYKSGGSSIPTLKDDYPRGILQEAGRFWENRRVLRRRDFMQVRRITSGLTRYLSPSRSPIRDQVCDDAAASGSESDAEVRINLPILQKEEPQIVRNGSQPTGSEPTTFEVDDEEDQLTRGIQSVIEANRGFTADGVNLVESERAIALSLLEGWSGPLDGDALRFDPDEIDKEDAD